ncbi:MAG: HAMP domain-containing histidine kinase, partial [Bacteroidia bacterium]|nr:HAMP domain-containing histidine kinase [Bacteroidia bacterium]
AVFGYTQRLFSILMAISSYVLFVSAYFFDFSILPHRDYTPEMELLNIIINFSVGMPASIMVIFLMITLNHRNAAELTNSNSLLKKVNAELDRFVYSTSHDLRAPLASVLGLIDIADRAPDAEESKRYLGMMRDRVLSLDKFVRDITDYSRNNRLEVARERFALADLAQEIWETLKFAPEASNIDFQLEIPHDAEVESDRNRLQIVLTNLIANAIRYHDQRKEDKYIRVRYHVNGKSFYLKVEDNGQGIEPEFQGRVFDMFFRANEKSKGSGLGLYIVKETMAKLAGSIQIESAPSVGTTITVKIPYKQTGWIGLRNTSHAEVATIA